MRKIILLIGLLSSLVSLTSKAQYSLKFGQAKFLTLEVIQQTTTLPDSVSIVFVVPANAVWKIESCGASCKSGSFTFPTNNVEGNLHIDNNLIYKGGSTIITQLPIWLPSGSYKLTLSTSLNNPVIGWKYEGYISAIEFLLTP